MASGGGKEEGRIQISKEGLGAGTVEKVGVGVGVEAGACEAQLEMVGTVELIVEGVPPLHPPNASIIPASPRSTVCLETR